MLKVGDIFVAEGDKTIRGEYIEYKICNIKTKLLEITPDNGVITLTWVIGDGEVSSEFNYKLINDHIQKGAYRIIN